MRHPTVQMTKLRSPSWPWNPGRSEHMHCSLLPSLSFCLLCLTTGGPGPGREHCCPRGSSVRSGDLPPTSSHCGAQGPPGLSAGPLGGAGGLGKGWAQPPGGSGSYKSWALSLRQAPSHLPQLGGHLAGSCGREGFGLGLGD